MGSMLCTSHFMEGMYGMHSAQDFSRVMVGVCSCTYSSTLLLVYMESIHFRKVNGHS